MNKKYGFITIFNNCSSEKKIPFWPNSKMHQPVNRRKTYINFVLNNTTANNYVDFVGK